MAMAHNGLAKLAEELGELQQVVGKMLAYGTGEHPDGKGSLLKRYEEESADVLAAIAFVSQKIDANHEYTIERGRIKLELFCDWDKTL